jgi:hypothetical protein
MSVVLAVCGGRHESSSAPFPFVDELGRFLATMPQVSLEYGACPGYPDRLVSAFLVTGSPDRVHGFSPHLDHQSGWPEPAGVRIDYTGLGSGRNQLIIEASTHALIFPGEWGTLSEACWALSRDLPVASPDGFAEFLNSCLQRIPIADACWREVAQGCLDEIEQGNPFTEHRLMQLVKQHGDFDKETDAVTPISTASDLASFVAD